MRANQSFALWAVLVGLLLSCSESSAFYNPETGRWLSRDPIEEQDSPNLYCYVRNGSLAFVDPFGRELFPPSGGTPVGDDRWDLPYEDFQNWLEEFLGDPLHAGELSELRRGCVGQCRILQYRHTGQPYRGGMTPERAEGTKCYKTQAQAKAFKCENEKTPFIFAKQGKGWKGGEEPEGAPDGEIPPCQRLCQGRWFW